MTGSEIFLGVGLSAAALATLLQQYAIYQLRKLCKNIGQALDLTIRRLCEMEEELVRLTNRTTMKVTTATKRTMWDAPEGN